MSFFNNTYTMLPRRPLYPVIRKLGKTEWTPHVKEDPPGPPPLDLAHLLVGPTLGMNLPLAQLSTLLGPPLATGLLAGGVKALPEGNLVGPRLLNLIHRTLGTKTSGSAESGSNICPCPFFCSLVLFSG